MGLSETARRVYGVLLLVWGASPTIGGGFLLVGWFPYWGGEEDAVLG